MFPQGNGKSQESVSESINAYYGVYLLGLAAGDDGMRDWGRVLLASEIRAARKYWQMPRGNGVSETYTQRDTHAQRDKPIVGSPIFSVAMYW